MARPFGSYKYQTLQECFDAKVNKADGCWLWTAGRTAAGYGELNWRGKQRLVHRLMWEMHHGPVPAGQYICHTCDNPPCCNPAHLFLGTPSDNTQDCLRKRRHSSHKLVPLPPGQKRYSWRPEAIQRGEAAPNAKLTAAQVAVIRQRFDAGGVTQSALAREYGVSISAIHLIVRGKNWRT